MENKVLVFLTADIRQIKDASSVAENKQVDWAKRLQRRGIYCLFLTIIALLIMASAVKLGPNSVASWLNQDDRLTTLSSGLFAAFLLFYLLLVLSAISDKAINLKRAWNHPGLYQMESLGRHYQKARALIVGLENFSKDELEEAQRFLADRLKQDSKFDDSVFGGISRMGITPALVLAFLSQGGIHKYISEGPSFATFAVLFYITFLVYALVLKLNTSSLKRYAFLLDEAIIRKSSKPRYLDANR